MLKVTNEDHFFHVKQHFPTTVSKHLWFGLKELSKMVMTTFPLIQGLGRPQIIILNQVSVYNRSVKNDRFVLLQASSTFTVELWEENIINSWVVGGFSPAIWKTSYTQIGNHFLNFSWWTFQKSLTPPPFVIPTPPYPKREEIALFFGYLTPLSRVSNPSGPTVQFPASLGGGKGAAASARAWRVKRLQPRSWTVRPWKVTKTQNGKAIVFQLPTHPFSGVNCETFGVVLGN